jgi:predicted nucleic acid-binding protein
MAREDVVIVRVTEALWLKALALYEARADKEWGLTDCISFEVMRERRIKTALTADHHFAQAGFAALLQK